MSLSLQRLSSQVLGQPKSAREEAEDKIMKDLQALRQRPDLEDSVFYPVLAAEFRRTIGHLVSQHAKGLLVEGEASPLIGREADTRNSLVRMRPYYEQCGNANARNRCQAKKRRLEQENVPSGAPFIMNPTAKRPRGVVQAMEQRLQKASGRMKAKSAGSIQEQLPRGVELPLCCKMHPASNSGLQAVSTCPR
jgi:hypothetical protein